MRRPKSPSEPPIANGGTAAPPPQSQPRAPEAPTIVSTAGGCVFGYWRNVIIEVWVARADLTLIAEVDSLIESVCRVHPKVSVVCLVVEQIPMPTPEARTTMQRMTARFSKQMVGTSILLGSSGFWASAVLGLLTSMQAVQRHLRMKTFTSMDELVAWTVKNHNAECDQPIDAEDLQRVLSLALERLEKPRS